MFFPGQVHKCFYQGLLQGFAGHGGPALILSCGPFLKKLVSVQPIDTTYQKADTGDAIWWVLKDTHIQDTALISWKLTLCYWPDFLPGPGSTLLLTYCP